MKHHHTKIVQSAAFEEAKRSSSLQKAAIQIDWAENDEIQLAHWHQRQESIFTVCCWMLGSNTQSAVVISDNLSHDTLTSSVSLVLALEMFLRDSTDCQSLHIFSDGPASQFKNRYILSLLPTLRTNFSMQQVRWSFFASSHGKGPVDGVGAVAKRLVWQSVRNRECIVKDASTFGEALSKAASNLRVILATEEEQNRIEEKLGMNVVFATGPPAHGVSSDHDWLCASTGVERSSFTQLPSISTISPLSVSTETQMQPCASSVVSEFQYFRWEYPNEIFCYGIMLKIIHVFAAGTF